MTKGSPYAHLIRFTIPIFLGSIFQLLYSTVDALIVGRFVGIDALAAIGATGGFTFLIIGFGQGLTMGFAILISHRYGAKDEIGMKKTYAMCMICSLFMSVILTVLALVTAGPLLRFIHTPADIYGDSLSYLITLYSGMIALIFYNMFSCVLRAIGDSRSPLFFLVVASVTNIVLDFVFVVYCGWGVVGAGVATVISQLLSAVLSCVYIQRKYSYLRLTRNDWSFDGEICWELMRLGIPGAAQNSVCAVGCVIVQGAANRFGTDYVAAFSIGLKIEGFLMAIFPCLGNAMATYAGQNLGAGDYQRIKKGFTAMTFIGLAVCTVITLLGYVIARPFTLLFMDESMNDPVVIENSMLLVRTIGLSWIPLASIFIYRSGCQGLGSASIPMYSSIGELLARVVTAYTLPSVLGFLGVILSENIAWTTGGIICPICLVHKMHGIKAELKNREKLGNQTDKA